MAGRAGYAALLAVLMGVGSAHAGFDDIKGRWVSEPLAIEDDSGCAPQSISVTIGGGYGKPAVEVKAGSQVDLDLALAKGQDGKVFVEQGGWLKRFGMSDETTREALQKHDPFNWARETETGAVVYRARITEDGGLNLFRIALEPVDGALAATMELTVGDCRIEPFTTSLKAQ